MVFFSSCTCLRMYFTGSDFLATIEQTELLDAENLVNFMAHFHMELNFYFPSYSLFLIQLLVRFTEQKHWVYYGKKSNQCSTKGQSFRVLPVAVSQTRGYYEVTLSDFNQNTHLLLKRLPAAPNTCNRSLINMSSQYIYTPVAPAPSTEPVLPILNTLHVCLHSLLSAVAVLWYCRAARRRYLQGMQEAKESGGRCQWTLSNAIFQLRLFERFTG